jgi:hypothetical protein
VHRCAPGDGTYRASCRDYDRREVALIGIGNGRHGRACFTGLT